MSAVLPLEKRRYTLEEFEQLPEGPPNFEYDEGEIIPLASPTFGHQDILTQFTVDIALHLRINQMGIYFHGVDVYLPDGNVFIPDFGFFSNQKQGMLWESDGKIHGEPDMVAEITSQDAQRDRVRKFHIYHANGVAWYWLIDKDTLEIEEYQWAISGYQLRTQVILGQVFKPGLFPGMKIDLAKALKIDMGRTTE